jgi:hypothetical protein
MTENSLDLFLHALLTAEEEVELAQRIEKDDLAAKERMINSNLRLVVSQARRYRVAVSRWRTWSRGHAWTDPRGRHERRSHPRVRQALRR